MNAQRRPTTVLSYGLGADSTCLLLRYLTDPSSRDFDLENLLVITAMTGDEWPHTGDLVTEHVLPVQRCARLYPLRRSCVDPPVGARHPDFRDRSRDRTKDDAEHGRHSVVASLRAGTMKAELLVTAPGVGAGGETSRVALVDLECDDTATAAQRIHDLRVATRAGEDLSCEGLRRALNSRGGFDDEMGARVVRILDAVEAAQINHPAVRSLNSGARIEPTG